jgi:hypothetical protein
MIHWGRIERRLRKKLRRSEKNAAGVKAYHWMGKEDLPVVDGGVWEK